MGISSGGGGVHDGRAPAKGSRQRTSKSDRKNYDAKQEAAMSARFTADEAASHRLPLGAHTLDLAQGELLGADGRPAPLRRQALDVLLVLGRQVDQVVTKGDLMRLVWPDVVVGDGSLSAAVVDIRRVLGDSEHRYVRNIARRGYMLVPDLVASAPVAAPAHVDAPAATATPASATTHPGTEGSLGDVASPQAVVRPSVVAPMRRGLVAMLAGIFATAGSAVWFVRRGTGSRTATAGPPVVSLVVLPLAVDTGAASTEWFAEALLGDVIAEVSRIDGSMVIARDTALTYKGRAVDPREVARELGVRWVVRGSVRYTAERVRLETVLIDGETGAQRWIESFESDRAELRRLLDDFAQTLSRLLVNEIYASSAARATRLTPDQVGADDLAMQGIALWQRGVTRENVLAAIDRFERAIAIDPGNLHGWAGVGYATLHADLNGWLADRAAARRRVAEAGARVEALDPDSYYGFQARVIRAFQQKDWPRMLALAEGWTLRHRHAHAYGTLGPALIFNDRPDEAVPALERALRISPREGFRAEWQYRLALAHYIAGRWSQAREWSETGQRANPGLTWPPIHAAALIEAGDREAAQRAWDEFAARHPGFDGAALLARLPGTTPRYAAARERMLGALRSLGLR
ncbi:MAG: winged helix-turn-helix domain-containing protein [Aquabacterium sp.]